MRSEGGRHLCRMSAIPHVFSLTVFMLVSRTLAVQHGLNVIWAQKAPKKIGYAKIVGIEGNPKDWVSTGNLNVRQISAPSILWHFKALAFHYATRTLYWSEKGNKRIQGLKLNGTTETDHVFNGTSSNVEGLAVDWLSHNLYFTDSVYNWVVMVGLNCSDFPHKIVTDTKLDKPMGIAVYPQKGYVFWSDWGVEPKIEMSDLVGDNRRTLVGKGMMHPRGLAVDYADNVLYWVDSGLDSVESVEFSGTNRRKIASQLGAGFYGIALYQDYLFVTEQIEGHLRIYDKVKGTNYVNYNLAATPYGIVMYDEDSQDGSPEGCAAVGCAHICVMGPLVGAKCYCGDGFDLGKDNRTCMRTEAFSKPAHIYTIGSAVCQYPANLPDMSLTNVTLDNQCFITKGNGFMALAFNVYENMLFVSENGTQQIFRAHFKQGATKEAIVGGVGTVQGMVVDWMASNLYWTDSTLNHIMVSRLDGSNQKVLIKLDPQIPLGVAVHPFRRKLFWTIVGPEAKIESSFLDGSYRQQLDLKGAPLGTPNHLFIDFKTNRLYWSDSSNDNIRYYDLDTGTVRTVITVENSQIFGISIFQDYIFWTDRADKNGVHIAFIENGKKVRGIIHPFVGIATDIIAFTENSQPILEDYCSSLTDETECLKCGNSNGGCEQLCLPNNGSQPFCACGLGFKLDINRTTCTSQVVDDTYLVVTDAYQKQLYQVSAVTGEFNAIHVSTHYRPIAIDIDPVEKKVYWSDITSNVIKRVNLDGTYEEVVTVLSADSVPDGIAVDYTNRLVYYTDTGRDEIGVISMTNTSKVKVIISKTTEEPRDIVVDPYEGSIFWTDWGTQPMIETASMDGTNRHTIVNLTKGSWPNGLAIDNKGRHLYWCDAKNNRIMSCDLTGGDREILYEETTAHYFGIALMGKYIYLTDWTRKSIMRLDRNKPVSLEAVGAESFGRLNGIQAYNSSEIIKETSVCRDGDCDFLCIPAPNRWKVCVCPTGFVLNKDDKSCSIPPSTTLLTTHPTSAPTAVMSTAVMSTAGKKLSTSTSMSSPTKSSKSPMTTTKFTSILTKTTTLIPKTTTVGRSSPAKTSSSIVTVSFQSSSSNIAPVIEKHKSIQEDTLHPGIISLIIILCLAIVAAGVFMGVFFYRRWRSDGRQKLVEDERVDSYYQIAFPESGNEEASLDSGIENPTYKYTMSELQASEAELMANLG